VKKHRVIVKKTRKSKSTKPKKRPAARTARGFAPVAVSGKGEAQKIATAAALGRLIGRTSMTVSRWTKRPDWTFGSAPWPASELPKIKNWAAVNLRDRSDVAPIAGAVRHKKPDDALHRLRHEKLVQECRKLRAQAAAFETALEQTRASLMDSATVERDRAAIRGEITAAFSGLPVLLAALAVEFGVGSLGAGVVQSKATRAIEKILGAFDNRGRRK
jgi:hypothetical protein